MNNRFETLLTDIKLRTTKEMGWESDADYSVVNDKSTYQYDNFDFPKGSIVFHPPYFYNRYSFNKMKGIVSNKDQKKKYIGDRWMDNKEIYDQFLFDKYCDLITTYMMNNNIQIMEIFFSSYGGEKSYARHYLIKLGNGPLKRIK